MFCRRTVQYRRAQADAREQSETHGPDTDAGRSAAHHAPVTCVDRVESVWGVWGEHGVLNNHLNPLPQGPPHTYTHDDHHHHHTICTVRYIRHPVRGPTPPFVAREAAVPSAPLQAGDQAPGSVRLCGRALLRRTFHDAFHAHEGRFGSPGRYFLERLRAEHEEDAHQDNQQPATNASHHDPGQLAVLQLRRLAALLSVVSGRRGRTRS